MQRNELYRPRFLFPRWRSLGRTPRHELAGNQVVPRSVEPNRDDVLSRAVGDWERSPNLFNAIEVVDAALLTQNYAAAAPAARQIVSHLTAMPQVVNTAHQVLGDRPDRPDALLPSPAERKKEDVYRAIARMKQRLIATPRDAVSAIELARLHVLLGQSVQAMPHIERALAVAPNNRFVLRSAARYFSHLADHHRALETLWQSEAVKVDPLLQSAEIATAQAAGRSPKWATRNLKSFLAAPQVPISASELSCGLAGLELEAGSKKKIVNRLIQNSLHDPTENTLAQVITLHVCGDISSGASEIISQFPNAFEARSRQADYSHKYIDAVKWTWEWLRDEPFSTQASVVGANLCSIFLNDHAQALQFADFGLLANPGNRHLLNAKFLSLTFTNRLIEAEALLPSLDRHKHSREFAPFIFAARGLLCFRQNRHSDGAAYYERALEAARAIDNASLVVRACIYWFQEEVRAMRVSGAEFHEIVTTLDDHISAVRPSGDLSQIWTAMKMRVAEEGRVATLPTIRSTRHRFDLSKEPLLPLIRPVERVL